MSKRPAFQFYPADWRNEAGLRLCSIAARGLWMDMLCLMHEGQPYGHLTVSGRSLSADSLARLVGEPANNVRRWLKELAENEVFSTDNDGLIFSRRMVRDEALREVRAEGGKAGSEHGHKGASHGSKGGRPRKETGDNKPPLNPPPSSSSSSPSAEEGSVAKATGENSPVLDLGNTPESSNVVDLDKLFWDNAKAYLKPHVKGDPGQIIGKWLREEGKAVTRSALSAAQEERAVNPIQFITGVFRKHRSHDEGSGGAAVFDGFA